jgi:hypothetical protein
MLFQGFGHLKRLYLTVNDVVPRFRSFKEALSYRKRCCAKVSVI